MNIRHSKILGVISLFGSLGVLMALGVALPTPALAEPKQIELLLSSPGSRDFETLVRQAEAVAAENIQKTFAENASVTEVSVMIVGEHQGQQVPLLSSSVSRANWEANPTVQAWTRYFGSAEVLLGFLQPQPSAPTAPPAPPFDPVAASMTDREPNFYQ